MTDDTERMLQMIADIKRDYGLTLSEEGAKKVLNDYGPKVETEGEGVYTYKVTPVTVTSITITEPWLRLVVSNPDVVPTPTLPGTLRLVSPEQCHEDCPLDV